MQRSIKRKHYKRNGQCPRCGGVVDDYKGKQCVYCNWVPKSVFREQKKMMNHD